MDAPSLKRAGTFLFLGVGQSYDDLKRFDAKSFADSLVN